MIPIGDDNRDRTITPYVNYVLIAINLIVFILFQGAGNNLEFTYAFSTVPQEIVTGEDLVTESSQVQDPTTGQIYVLPGLQPTPISVYITLLTSMFMHGGWAHILGNMLYLWIFGDNLEDRLGHGRYLLFYLLVGLLASLAHVFTSVLIGDNLQIPSLGASGAIAGVLGGYLLLFPGRRVTVILVRVVTQVRAIFAVGLWFLLQLVGGLGVLGGGSDGVAYAAHIGGFIAGLALIKLFAAGRQPQRTQSW
ncbi:MAG: rhomboid family intramembrane serine protease [Anaerolineaceae bacterium]|nr:rhomboid family intramembrane serine protease [Anaerolineaceae bacterium]